MASKPQLYINLVNVQKNAERFLSIARENFPNKIVKVFFALKSHPSFKVLKILKKLNIGCEVMTSKGMAWGALLDMPTTVSGFVKPDSVIEKAIKSAEYIVIETEFEIPKIIKLAHRIGVRPSVFLRVKCTADSKIGCSQDSIKAIAQSPDLHIKGVHFHTGWNVKDEKTILGALERMYEAKVILKKEGRSPLAINFGGSFCEHSSDPGQLNERMRMFSPFVDADIEEVHFEPGRYLVGDAGVLKCHIEYIDYSKNVLYIDTCAHSYRMTGATPKISLPFARLGDKSKKWSLYGFWPTEGDRLDQIKIMGSPRPGDQVVFENMGAYIHGMESQFCVDEPMSINYKETQE